MKSKFAQIAMALAVLASMMVAGCSEKENDVKELIQKNASEAEAPINKKLSAKEHSTEGNHAPVEMSDRELDSLVELNVKKEMEKESFKRMAEEQKRFNDSLDQIKGNRFPHKPGPEGVLKILYRNCLKKGNCPNE